ncbi:MAG TPA: amidohydrolase family protein [Dehalococcoidia bacterium]|nr:amidohydrolase family protein [Dehalococcoidia bacterium]
MIIDVHYHYMRLPAGDATTRSIASGWLLDAERTGVKKSLDEMLPAYRDLMDDPDCDKLVSRMDKNGIDITVICVVDNVDYGANDDRILGVNSVCAGAAAKHPGRLLSLAGIDPRRPEAPSLLRRCIEEFGMNGLKWHPDSGYYPNSPEALAVLEVLNEFGFPLLTHCSPLPRSRAKFAHPIHLDDIAFTYPDLQVIAAHMGHIWWHEWAALAQYKRNIVGDLAMWQLTAVSKPQLFRRYLREILDILGPEQVLFASDGPVFEPLISNRDWIGMLKDLQNTGSDGISFTREEIDAILGGNAARVFKLPE